MHAFHEVLKAFFSPQSFRVALPDVWAGFQVNLKMMVVAELLVLVFALAIAVVRGLPGRAAAPLRGLAIVYTAYVTEVYRAGIESVHPSQRSAARSLGLSYWQAMRYVVIPQAVRRVVPPLLNDFVGLQKDTAIVSVIGVAEAASLAQQFSTQNGDFASYVAAAVFFILLTIPLARFTDHLIAQRELRERAQAV